MTEKRELKDIKWANKEIKKARDLLNNKRYEEEVDDLTTGVLLGLKKALNILDQLDKPKVLSQKWIDEHEKGVFMDGKGRKKNFVWVDDLQNLLVQKQEVTEEHGMSELEWAEVINRYKWHLKQEGYVVIEKPTIPQFVAEHIKIRKGETLAQAYNISTHTKVGKWLLDKENCETFAKALLYGFTVQKEHKYYARIKGWQNVTTGSEAFNWVYFKEKDTVGISKAVENKYQAVSFTKYDWNNLGINEDNADLILVEELE